MFLSLENLIIETLILRPSKFHNKKKAQGGDKHCLIKSIRYSLKNYLYAIEKREIWVLSIQWHINKVATFTG